MSLTGNFVGTRQALEWGLLNEVVPHDELVGRAQALAADVAGIEAATVSAMKRLYWATGSVTPAEGLTVEREVNRSWTECGGLDRPAFADRRADISARAETRFSWNDQADLWQSDCQITMRSCPVMLQCGRSGTTSRRRPSKIQPG